MPAGNTGVFGGVTSLKSCFVVGDGLDLIPRSRSRAMRFLRRPVLRV